MAPLLDGDPRQIGVYRIVGRLGAGGMGQVFLGQSLGGLAVAVKVIHEAIAADPGFRARFRREVVTARAVSGAFTAAVVDAGPDAPRPWLATVFLEGRPLNEAVAEHGPLPPQAVASLGAGLAEALIAVHRAGIVHRDLKPGNVMLSPDGPRVIDFGIAHTTGATAITRSGTIVGTPAYMSPEQARGQESGPPGDVFSLGGVLAFAATGQGPFEGTRPEVTVYRVIHDPPALDAVTDPALRDLIAACLDKDPSRRPTPAELLQRLRSGAPQGVAWLPPSMAAAITEATAPLSPPRGAVGRRTLILAGTGLTALVATGAVAAARRAGDEPGGRGGPGGGPVRTGTLVRRISVGESLAGGPALAQGLAVVTTTSGELHAFDLAGGLRRWRYVPAAGESGAFTSTPVAADSTVYAVNDSGYLHAVDVATGERRWARKAGVLGSPPAVCGGRVYVWTGAGEGGGAPSLAVFDTAGKGRPETTSERVLGAPVTDGHGTYVLTAEGIDVYQNGAARPTRSTGVPATGVLTVAGGTLYGTPIQHGDAWAYDTRGQRMLWEHRRLSSEIRFSAGATGARDLVYIPDAEGGLLAFRPRGGRLAQRWRLPLPARIEVPPVVAGGVVYAGATDRAVYAVDAATGRLRWRYPTGGSIITPPVVAGSLVHVGGRDGFLYTLRA